MCHLAGLGATHERGGPATLTHRLPVSEAIRGLEHPWKTGAGTPTHGTALGELVGGRPE